jgi:hypothetical protein
MPSARQLAELVKPPIFKQWGEYMQKQAKDILKQIDKLFSYKPKDETYTKKDQATFLAIRELWDVLTALRGPDDYKLDYAKEATTAVIRSTAFPKTFARNNDNVPAIFAKDSLSLTVKRNDIPRSSHFQRHAEDAFTALGLQWDENNADVEVKRG